MSEADMAKRLKTLLRNREAATKCRNKKKQYTADLEETCRIYQTNNGALWHQFLVLWQERDCLLNELNEARDRNGFPAVQAAPFTAMAAHWQQPAMHPWTAGHQNQPQAPTPTVHPPPVQAESLYMDFKYNPNPTRQPSYQRSMDPTSNSFHTPMRAYRNDSMWSNQGIPQMPLASDNPDPPQMPQSMQTSFPVSEPHIANWAGFNPLFNFGFAEAGQRYLAPSDFQRPQAPLALEASAPEDLQEISREEGEEPPSDSVLKQLDNFFKNCD
ncbi:hypothetical protein K469DRAFT_626934 [Zopfia rhizophila CBS 207.26]|uniref:BZIP domain-containing protein n=1 Tax=Zopfia rhizophila CBS 207.26 TaxID=1314779 RepID=A0A6A6EBB6_9PEZI|nr:hypothetical protein K469DRAFT_626934 [Zopfia rhizophila CBS 207.26]